MAFECFNWVAKELNENTAAGIEKWTGGRLVEEIDPETAAKIIGLNFPGADGVMRASEGDYVVQMRDGSFQRWSAGYFKSQVMEML